MSTRTRLMEPADYAFILGSVGLGATGQVLMRLGMADLGGAGLLETIIAGLTQPLVWLGLVSYALSSALWLVALSRVPLSAAYPFGALSYVIVVLASVVTAEHVGVARWAGVVLIVGGIWLIGGAQGGAPTGAARGEAQ